MGHFKDKVVVVTGAASGIGRSIALAFAHLETIVFLADINEQKGEELENDIRKGGGEAHFIATDVSIPVSIEALFEIIDCYRKKVDILINNAGVSERKSPFEMSLDSWDRIINTNLRSVFLCSREAAARMPEGSAIVNIASTRAMMSEPNSEAYAASKGGIVALTHAMAASLATKRIQVNCISPGWIEVEDYAGLRKIDHTQHFSQRVGIPEDIARACIFLSDPANNFISGENLVIDGGMTRRMKYEE
jgi:NAD(P)-dependent dehydrogenase (short-subunit alcohol dehydrogenase family)